MSSFVQVNSIRAIHVFLLTSLLIACGGGGSGGGGGGGNPPAADNNQPPAEPASATTFADIVPDNALRNCLAVNNVVNTAQLETLELLFCDVDVEFPFVINDFSGLEIATSLRKAIFMVEARDLETSTYASLEPLRNLEQLELLELRYVSNGGPNYKNDTLDLSPIAALPSLEILSIKGELDVDFTPLASSASLNELVIGECLYRYFEDSDINAARSAATLITGCTLGANIVGLNTLVSLSNIETFYLFQVFDRPPLLNDLSIISGMTNLRSLTITSPRYFNSFDNVCFDTPISNLNVLLNFINLEELSFHGITFTDFGALANASKLTSIDIDNSADVNCPALPAAINPSGLSSLPELKDIELRDVGITDLSVLSNNTKLETVTVDYRFFGCLSCGIFPLISGLDTLGNLSALQSLDVKSPDIAQWSEPAVDLSKFSSLTELTTLILGQFRIENLDALSTQNVLEELRLINVIGYDQADIDTLTNLVESEFVAGSAP